jgi:hypothetical protein
VDAARAAQALAPRVAPAFLKWKEFLKYSIENIQYSILFTCYTERSFYG